MKQLRVKHHLRWLSAATALALALPFMGLSRVSHAEEGEKVLKVQVEVEVASLDTAVATDGTSFEVLANMIDGLYEPDASGQAVPALVESEEVNEAGTEYRFKLKEAKWQNGTPVTAHDFVFSWQRLCDPETHSEYSYMVETAGVKNAAAVIAGEKKPEELGIHAEDDQTLVVELDFPVPFFHSLMYFPIFYPINQEFFESTNGQYATSPETFLANGAFTLKSYEPAATSFELEKNPDYYNAERIKLDGLQYQVIKDNQAAALAFNSGEVDITRLGGEQVDLYKEDPAFQTIRGGYLWYMAVNQKVSGFESTHMRKAVVMSIDKQNICDTVLKDGSVPANFAVPIDLATGPDGKDFRDSAGSYLEFDAEAAKEEFAKAKEELGKDSFQFEMIYEDTEASTNVAQKIKEMVESNLEGVEISLKQMPKKNRIQLTSAKDFEISLTRWGPDYADPMTYLALWTTDAPYNYGSWSNEEYDKIVKSCQDGELSLDQAARWEALHEAEKIAMEDAVILPVYQVGGAYMIAENVHDVHFHSVALNRVYKDAYMD
ncbi:MAG: peptide ABC transporter substrate-binding protein [Eubacteriales bacterium]|nr:peptide ABC transporter substrate-binding protein [Eubacteriales bacterium]